MALVDSGDYTAAYLLLNETDNENSKKLQESIKIQYERVLMSEAETGSFVIFGTYEQDDNTADGKENIEWIVLTKEDKRILLISRYALDCQMYNKSDESESITWEDCSVREWLNETFMNTAFSEDERALIPELTVNADNNPSFDVSPGNSTTDRVFLLSILEVQKYFGSDNARVCLGTAYCNAHRDKHETDNCSWWLRSPGNYSSTVAYINDGGSIINGGIRANYRYNAIRPALWINLES